MELAEQERKSKPLYKAANGVAKRLVKHEVSLSGYHPFIFPPVSTST